MLGVPTKSDAIALAPDYAEAVETEELQERLRLLRGVFNGVLPNNHVVGAYHDTDCFNRFPMGKGIPAINPKRIPKTVDRLLKPEMIRDSFLDSIKKLREALEDARSYLDRETNTVIMTADYKPLTDLYEIIGVEECVTDSVFESDEHSVSIVEKKGAGKGWKYTYNPYQLAHFLLDDFERNILSVFELEPSKIKKIVSMMVTGEKYEKSSNYQLAEGSLSHLGSEQAWGFPYREGHLVHRLSEENEAIGRRSDLTLDFDERSFAYKHPNEAGDEAVFAGSIPAAGLLDSDNRYSCYSLSHRAHLRYLLGQLFQSQGFAVINGVKYEPHPLKEEGKTVDGCLSDDGSYQEITNLLGTPIQQPDGTVLKPEAWAQEEVELVAHYLPGIQPTTDELLAKYDCDTSSGNPTKKKEIQQLTYSLDVAGMYRELGLLAGV